MTTHTPIHTHTPADSRPDNAPRRRISSPTLRLAGNEIAAHKRRLVSTGLAVLIGVAFLAGSLVLIDTIRSTLDGLLASADRSTDVYVEAVTPIEAHFGQPSPPIDASLVDRVRGVDGVAAAAPRIQGYAQLVHPDGTPVGSQAQGAPLLGLNWVAEPGLNPYRLTEGRAPSADDEIVIDRGTARSDHFSLGQRVTVLTRGEPRPFTIVGIARFGSADSIGGAHSVLFTDTTAQALISAPGQIDGIAVEAAPGITQADLVARIGPVLGSEAEAITGHDFVAQTQANVAENFKQFNLFLEVFAGIALFVGAFIINNTFSILVAQRTREMALLRAIGASGRQVTGAVLYESVVIGAVASAAGVGAGLIMARMLKALMAVMGFAVPANGTVLTTRTIVVSVVVGLVVTVVSAVLPARRAARVAPIAALRSTAIDRSSTSTRRIVLGGLITATGVGLLGLGLSAPAQLLVAAGAAVTFVGVSVLAPVMVGPVTRVLGWPLTRAAGAAGQLGVQNTRRNPKRTARTAAALMIGVSLVAFITIFAASTKDSITGSIGRDFHGDYVVDSGSFDGAAGLAPTLAASLRTTNGVEVVSPTRVTTGKVAGVTVKQLNAWDPATVGQVFDLGEVTGSLAGIGTDGLAASSAWARDHGLSVGDRVPVVLASGQRDFTLQAIFTNSDQWTGKVWIGLAAVPDALDYRIYVKAADGDAVRTVASAYPAAKVMDRAGLAASAGQEIDQVLSLIYVMLALAVVIALLGIANTLALSIHERSREIGLLRAVGMTRAQTRAAVRYEAVLISLFGTGLGLAVGVFFGWAMVKAMAGEGIDRLSLPATPLLAMTAIAVVAGLVAALLPSRRASRLDVLGAISGAES